MESKSWERLKHVFQESVIFRDDKLQYLDGLLARGKLESDDIASLNHTFSTSVADSNRLIATMKSVSRDALSRSHVQRCSDKLVLQQSEWNRLCNQIKRISEFSILLAPKQKPATNSLVQERMALVQSIGAVDTSLESAMYASEMLKKQKESISGFKDRLSGLTSRVPGINSILSRIQTRQSFERIVLGLVVAVCICILLWMRILT